MKKIIIIGLIFGIFLTGVIVFFIISPKTLKEIEISQKEKYKTIYF